MNNMPPPGFSPRPNVPHHYESGSQTPPPSSYQSLNGRVHSIPPDQAYVSHTPPEGRGYHHFLNWRLNQGAAAAPAQHQYHLMHRSSTQMNMQEQRSETQYEMAHRIAGPLMNTFPPAPPGSEFQLLMRIQCQQYLSPSGAPPQNLNSPELGQPHPVLPHHLAQNLQEQFRNGLQPLQIPVSPGEIMAYQIGSYTPSFQNAQQPQVMNQYSQPVQEQRCAPSPYPYANQGMQTSMSPGAISAQHQVMVQQSPQFQEQRSESSPYPYVNQGMQTPMPLGAISEQPGVMIQQGHQIQERSSAPSPYPYGNPALQTPMSPGPLSAQHRVMVQQSPQFQEQYSAPSPYPYVNQGMQTPMPLGAISAQPGVMIQQGHQIQERSSAPSPYPYGNPALQTPMSPGAISAQPQGIVQQNQPIKVLGRALSPIAQSDPAARRMVQQQMQPRAVEFAKDDPVHNMLAFLDSED